MNFYHRNFNRATAMKPKFTPKSIETELAFQAAAAAFRSQGDKYIKQQVATEPSDLDEQSVEIKVKSNRELVQEFIDNPELITDQDRELAANVRRHYQGLQFQILSGKVLGDLDSKALAYACGETVTTRDLGLIAYLPEGFARAQKRNDINDRIADARGGLIGKIGDKISCNVEILRVIFSQNYGCFFVTGLTDSDQPVFFSMRNQMAVGQTVHIQGKVKAHRDNQTQLNYVKII